MHVQLFGCLVNLNNSTHLQWTATTDDAHPLHFTFGQFLQSILGDIRLPEHIDIRQQDSSNVQSNVSLTNDHRIFTHAEIWRQIAVLR